MDRIYDFSWKECNDLHKPTHEGIIAIPLAIQKRDPHQYALEEIRASMVVDSFKNRIAKTLSERRATMS